MPKVGSDFYFCEKSLRAKLNPDLTIQDLDCDHTIVFEVAREVDRRHPTSADLALDRIAIGKCCFELRDVFNDQPRMLGRIWNGKIS